MWTPQTFASDAERLAYVRFRQACEVLQRAEAAYNAAKLETKDALEALSATYQVKP